jgi:hypothetical protein
LGHAIAAVTFLVWAFLAGSSARASSAHLEAIDNFPEHCEQVAHLDLAQARAFPWFVALKTKIVPVQFYRFENFISSPQMGLGNQILGVYWAVVAADQNSPGGVIGIATGEFDKQTAESQLDSMQTPSYKYGGYTLYATGSDFGDSDLLVAFLDSDTVAFGPRRLLDQLIRVRAHAEPTLQDNTKLMALIRQQKTDGIFWSVTSGEAARAALARLLPGSGGIPGITQAMAGIDSLTIAGAGSTGAELDLTVVGETADPQDALMLSTFLQAGIMLKQYQVRPQAPDIAELLGDIVVNANGIQIFVTASIKNNQAAALIQNGELLMPAM